MDSIAALLQGRLFEPKSGHQLSERDVVIGELFKNVDEADRKNLFYTVNGKTKKRRLDSIKSFAYRLSPHSLEELYYLKSICDDCKKRGGNYSRCLFGALKVK